jgi:hypothetical protein
MTALGWMVTLSAVMAEVERSDTQTEALEQWTTVVEVTASPALMKSSSVAAEAKSARAAEAMRKAGEEAIATGWARGGD